MGNLSRKIALYALIFASCFFAATALAQEDHLPPKLIGITFSAATLDVSKSAAQCRINIALTDDVSGVVRDDPKVSYWAVELASPSGGQERVIFNSQLKLVSGTPLNGVWSSEFTMPQYSEPGIWKVRRLTVADGAGNRLSLSSSSEIHDLDSATLKVISDVSDKAAPKIEWLDFVPDMIGPADLQHVKVKLRATDDLSGVDMTPDGPNGPSDGIMIKLRSPSGKQTVVAKMFDKWILLEGTPRDGIWEAKLEPQFFGEPEPGTWEVQRVRIKDAVRNIREYRGSELSKNHVVVLAPTASK